MAEDIGFAYHTANHTLQIRHFLTCAIRFNELDVTGTVEVPIPFDKGIVQAVKGFPFFFMFGLVLCFFGVKLLVNITHLYIRFSSCFLRNR